MDDAAVTRGKDGNCLVHTVDFFTPMVDDAAAFGAIAAANAISDVFAMGGQPMVALGILGWPIDTLGAELAAQVITGARQQCEQIGIPLAGGHSIESNEPFFGLSVTGQVAEHRLKTNAGAQEGDLLFLTKPIGTGMLSSAFKRAMLDKKTEQHWIEHMMRLNDVGGELSSIQDVHAMTDVTGFGLLGHLSEVCKASSVGAYLDTKNIPMLLPSITAELMKKMVMPDSTMRNFKAFGALADKMDAATLQMLCDPQTNGGLLLAVDPKSESTVTELLKRHELHHRPIGQVTSDVGRIRLS